MPRIKILVLAVLALIAISTLAFAAPIPLSAVGINKAINVIGGPDRIEMSAGGGRFGGSVAGNSTYLWCVDIENQVSLPASYQGNVTLLDSWTGGVNGTVQKGTIAPAGWTNYNAGPGALTALQRYQAAAYLIETMAAFNASTDVPTDDPIQDAIWALLDIPALHYATSGISDTAAQYIRDNPNFGFGNWAVVSGPVDAQGRLSGQAVQTLLVQVEPIPEPGTYAMMGAGLIGLAVISRRKKV